MSCIFSTNSLLLWKTVKTAWPVSNITDALQYLILRHFPYRDYDVRWGDDQWIRKDVEGCGRCLIETLLRIFLEGMGKPRDTSVRTANVPARIRSEHLPNTILQQPVRCEFKICETKSFSHTFISLWKRGVEFVTPKIMKESNSNVNTFLITRSHEQKKNSGASVRQWTTSIPTEPPLLVGEVSANFSG
jgi:hypothetical protein